MPRVLLAKIKFFAVCAKSRLLSRVACYYLRSIAAHPLERVFKLTRSTRSLLDSESDMALTDDLKDYITRNSTTVTKITEKHHIAIVGETHLSVDIKQSAEESRKDMRVKAVVRLLLELLKDPKYKFLASEHFFRTGVIRTAVDRYMRDKTVPPAAAPSETDMEKIARRVEVIRFQPVLDFIKATRREILSIGSIISKDSLRDMAMVREFAVEFKEHGFHGGDAGILHVGANHSQDRSDHSGETVRQILEKWGFTCVSIRVVTSVSDLFVEQGRALDWDKLPTSDFIGLKSLVAKTPVTIPTDRKGTGGKASPFRSLVFASDANNKVPGGLKGKVPVPTGMVPVAEQFEYIVLQ